MSSAKEIMFRVHGLEHHKDAVDAGVFARKLAAFVRALKTADANGNGRRCLDFLIADLEMGSAAAHIIERDASTKHPSRSSGIDGVHAALASIYGGRLRELNGSSNIVPAARSICLGVSRAFSHIDIVINGSPETAIRIDTFFEKQVKVATDYLATEEEKDRRRLFKGVSIGMFDGTLKAVDHRGSIKLARLILTAGGAEIECAYSEDMTEQVRPAFDKRAIIDAAAHYDASSGLPSRLDLKSIRVIKSDSNLLRWKGSFAIADDGEEW